jgi:hypothetical protein
MKRGGTRKRFSGGIALIYDDDNGDDDFDFVHMLEVEATHKAEKGKQTGWTSAVGWSQCLFGHSSGGCGTD